MAYFLQRLFLFFLFYLLTESSASGEDSVPLIVTGILGESVILPLKIPKEHQITYVAWNSQRSLATLMTEEEGKPPKIIINPYYKERVNFLHENNIYSPRISHLKMEDAGSYTAEITIANIPNPIRKLFSLFIHERLTKPKIMSDPRIHDNGTCLINVTCFVEQVRENVTYNWIPLGQRTDVSSEGHILHIRWKPGDHDQYTCTARNPVSNSTYTILASKLCEGFEHDKSYITVLCLVISTISVIFFILGLSFWHIQRKKTKGFLHKDQSSNIIFFPENPMTTAVKLLSLYLPPSLSLSLSVSLVCLFFSPSPFPFYPPPFSFSSFTSYCFAS
ncbi:SLAM family member 9-like isoform X2 [Antechinus flavipes]|uniref:SLAM family member 9-like isoform X2 n=1 Tax=Antechinus flavipes TaxID=38775 RepID=UPI0022356CE7|nr:SLAM family member 9-like isoform X2 [Antechinus flavipes]